MEFTTFIKNALNKSERLIISYYTLVKKKKKKNEKKEQWNYAIKLKPKKGNPPYRRPRKDTYINFIISSKSHHSKLYYNMITHYFIFLYKEVRSHSKCVGQTPLLYNSLQTIK